MLPYSALPVFSSLRTLLFAFSVMTLSDSLKTSDWMNTGKDSDWMNTGKNSDWMNTGKDINERGL